MKVVHERVEASRRGPTAAALVFLLLAGCASADVAEGTAVAQRDTGRETADRDTDNGAERQDTAPEPGDAPQDTAPESDGDAGQGEPDTGDAESERDSTVPVDTAPNVDTTPVICEAETCAVGPGNECCSPACDEANACVTVANACPDVCGGASLTTGRTCRGCGAANAAGACGAGRVALCDAATANQCATETCGGATWSCTLRAGVWAWTTEPVCDDGNDCTAIDRCSGGICAGSSYVCADRPCGNDRCDGALFVDVPDACASACDGAGGCEDCVCEETVTSCAATSSSCCVAGCDAAHGCVTSPGSCGGVDVCGDPNRLTVSGLCEGCGVAGADGACVGAGDFVCDNTTHTACQQVSCGGVLHSCTNLGGTWRWSPSPACDDGNACTYDDRCAAGTCAGFSVSCESSDCVQRSCNGTAACSETVRGGATCDDADACTVGERCNTAGRCVDGVVTSRCGDGSCACGETNASCASDCAPPLPSNACAAGSQSRDGCGSARVIGRAEAAAGWASGEQNTCSARDRHDDACPSFDVGFDHSYAVYLRAGERVVAELGVTSRRCDTSSSEEFHSYLKFKFNPDASAAGASACPSFVSCAGGPYRTQTTTALRDYVATSDGWLFVIVDGGSTAFEEHRGYYNLSVTLSRCADAGCGC